MEATRSRTSSADIAHWLAEALRGLPVQVETLGRSGRADIAIKAGDGEYLFELKSAGGGWPSTIRRLAAAPGFSRDHQLFFAETFSAGAVTLLEELGLNWVDAHGNVRAVQWPGLVVSRLRGSPVKASRSPFRWTRSAEDIAEHLLAHPQTPVSVHRVATELDWSGPQVSRTLSQFDRLDWTERAGGRKGPGVVRRIGAEAGAMLDSWSEHLNEQSHQVRHMHAIGRDLLPLVAGVVAEAVGEHGDAWAFGGLASAQLRRQAFTAVPRIDIALAPILFDQVAFWKRLESEGLRSAGEGGSVAFRMMDDRIFRHADTVGGYPVLSVPRTYAELLVLGGRASETARELREDLIGV